jgi:Sigma-70, region 4
MFGNSPRYTARIAIAAPPDVAPGDPASGQRQYVPRSLVDLVRELGSLARRDARFERAATLAAELEEELTRLSDQAQPMRRRRRARQRSDARTMRISVRLFEAFQIECRALGATCQRLQEQGVVLSEHQLADLRLGQRTRRVFHEAGLFYVEDVANLSPERAVEIPHLTPSSIAEVRAAIMFSLQKQGAHHPPMLPPPGANADLFEGVVRGVNRLPRREREVVILRTGVEDRVYEIDEVARALGCPAELVPQLERHALNTLLSQPASIEACWRLADLCAQLGLGWDDERLPTVVAARYPNTRASFTRLVAWLMREQAHLVAEAAGRSFAAPAGIRHFEEMVVATLGRYGPMLAADLTGKVRSALSTNDRVEYPEVDVAERVQILGPAQRTDDGRFRLPDAPIPGLDDRRIRALNGLIGALQRLGTARISSLTTEVNKRLPRSYHVNEQYVRSWLMRHPELFTQSDAERFKLASLDVDILCGLASSWQPADTASAVASARPNVSSERLHERMASEIAELLKREGPQTIGRIRAHLYGRFIGRASADLIISQSTARFVRDESGLISLREADDLAEADTADDDLPTAVTPPRRIPFWQRR